MAKKGAKGKAIQAKELPSNTDQSNSLELARLRHRTRIEIVDRVYRLLRGGIGAAAIVLVTYFVRQSIGDIAGKTTDFKAVASGVFGMSMNEWAAYGLSAILGVAWFNERRLRRRTIKDQGHHIRDLEDRLAPDRQSSGLQPDGSPREEDRDV